MRFRNHESGFVVPLFAAFAALMVLFILGWGIDLPTRQAAIVRTQFALDVGVSSGVMKFWDPWSSTKAVYSIARAAEFNTYNSGQKGIFFNDKFSVSGSGGGGSVPGVGPNYGKMIIGMPNYGYIGNGGTYCGSIGNPMATTMPGAVGVAKFRRVGLSEIQVNPPFAYPSGNVNCDTFYSAYSQGGGAPNDFSFAQLSAKYFNFDYNGTNIRDFGNGIIAARVVNPNSYFFRPASYGTSAIVSGVRLVNTFTGILIDPAVPLGANGTGPSNYDLIFDVDEQQGKPSTETFPLAAYRIRNGYDVNSYPGQTVTGLGPPEWDNFGFSIFAVPPPPVSSPYERAVPFYWDPSGTKNLVNDVDSSGDLYRRVLNFFSATCDSLPFFFYKSAAVNLVDRFTRSSAFNPTMAIGVTGYGDGKGVVPIFPTEYGGTYEKFVAPSTYPLQVNSTGQIYVSDVVTTAYRGWVDPRRFDNAGNYPELLHCSEYYTYGDTSSPTNLPDGPTSFSGINGAQLPEDLSHIEWNFSGIPYQLDHYSPGLRVRANSSGTDKRHWLHDTSIPSNIPSTPDLTRHQSGTYLGGSGGERPRNLIGLLGMRMNDYNFQVLDGQISDPKNWHRPAAASAKEGYRYLPDSIRQMCTQISDSSTAYNANNSYGVVRPIQQQALVVFGFGNHSADALAAKGFTKDDAYDDFVDAIQECICGKPDFKLIFALLPFDTESSDQVVTMVSKIKDYEQGHNMQCVGQTPPICGGGPMGSVFTLVYDYNSSRFSTGTTASSTAKINASRAFSEEVYETVTKLLSQWVYAG